MRILLVEAEQTGQSPLHTGIEQTPLCGGFGPAIAKPPWELLNAFLYDLVLLDVPSLPLDGISLCRRLAGL